MTGNWRMAPLSLALFATVCAGAASAAAQFDTVTSRAQFEELIAGRELRRFGIRLTVTPGGRIAGRAFGGDVTGAWDWTDGYFCRALRFRGNDLGFNCQRVEVRGDTLRFTTDRGTGIYADLRLR